jgi:hypothetical protein
MVAISKKRLALIRELEEIIGRECYHPKIQNRGAGGVLESEGRQFRYPITFTGPDGEKIKRWSGASELPAAAQMSGHYAFGSNKLRIMQALDTLLSHLEETRSLKV